MAFKYGRGTRQTKVKQDAGKHAVFNERFSLTNISAEIQKDGALVLDAMEKDVASSDLLGSTKPIKWSYICSFDGTVRHDVEIANAKGQKVGNVVFKTQFLWEDYKIPEASSKLDKKSMLRVIVKSASFKKDADTFGKQDPFIQFKY